MAEEFEVGRGRAAQVGRNNAAISGDKANRKPSSLCSFLCLNPSRLGPEHIGHVPKAGRRS